MQFNRQTIVFWSSLILTLGVSGTMRADSLTVRLIQIFSMVKLNNVVIRPGSYQLKILDKSGTAEIVVSRGSKVLVTAVAECSKQTERQSKNSLVVNSENVGVPQVIELRIAGDNRNFKFVKQSGSEGAQSTREPQNQRISEN